MREADTVLTRPYVGLVALRFALCFLQTGYVHPDEFMQSMEPVAERLLGVNATVPWEFTSRLPLRSWSCLLMTCVVPALLAPAQHQLLAVRLFMCCLSLLTDVSVERCARLLGVCRRRCLLTLASCHATFVLAVRPLSNSLELTLSALLLWLVLDGVAVSSAATASVRRLRRRLAPLAGYAAHRLRLAEAEAEAHEAAVRHAGRCGALLALGVFVRPTFVLFAGVPLLYWLLRGASGAGRSTHAAAPSASGDHSTADDAAVKQRLVRLLRSAAVSGVCLAACDSLVYGWLDVQQLLALDVGWHSVVLTPFNFAVYNVKAHNLAAHGVHWRGTHAFVNAPLLFSSLAVLAGGAVIAHAGRLLRHLINLDWHVSTAGVFLAAATLLPLLALSAPVHQEPRFLLPLLVPLTLMFSDQLHGGGGRWKRTRTLLRVLWWSWNTAALLFYGFVHQAGVTRALLHLRHIRHTELNETGAAVFWHTYTPPRSLLLLPIAAQAPSDGQFIVHDMAGSRVDEVRALLMRLASSGSEPRTVYVALPASVQRKLLDTLPAHLRRSLRTERRFWPHLSVEAPPSLSRVISTCGRRSVAAGLWCAGAEMMAQLSLVLLRIDKHVVTG